MIHYTYAIRNDRQAKGRETMTRDQAVEYVTVGSTAGMTATDKARAVIHFAEDRGYWLDDMDYGTIMFDNDRRNGFKVDYCGDLDGDLTDLANRAAEWLTDQGLLPDGYGYDDERATDGYGIDTRGEGS